jgi:23S rRNA (cytidine1920-2'-O)/16S rRNA (cytidine1409-2'-O)-methyltransferase
MAKQRLDNLLVARELTETRNKAQALIMAGKVTVDDKVITKPGTPVDETARILLKEPPQYVSRGGIKLAHALDEFKIDVSGLTVMDIGASTGGFTDCLLQHGAARVYAIDVGYGQIDYKLRQDPRVVIMDRTNARHPFQLPGKADMATIDVSFISVTKIIPSATLNLKPHGNILVLLKTQFEAERGCQICKMDNRKRFQIQGTDHLTNHGSRGKQGIPGINQGEVVARLSSYW